MNPQLSLPYFGPTRHGTDESGPRKRRKPNAPLGPSSSHDALGDAFGHVDPLANIELYNIQDTFTFNPQPGSSDPTCSSQLQSQGRPASLDLAFNDLLVPSVSPSTNDYDFDFDFDFDSSGLGTFPNLSDYVVLEAEIPSPSARNIVLSLTNPYADNASNRIAKIAKSSRYNPGDGKVNGYLKLKVHMPTFQEEVHDWRPLRFLHSEEPRLQIDNAQQDPRLQDKRTEGQKQLERALGIGGSDQVSRMPPNFALGCKLAVTEQKLLRFYVDAWCSGRTILPQSNCWKVDIGPMVSKSECVRNAIFSLACSYILDFNADERLRLRANEYYEKSVQEIGARVADPTEWEVGKADDLIGAFTLLNMHDVVNWEHRRDKDQVPRWLEGARTASRILDATDPGYRYYKPFNVQVDRARMSNAVNCGRLAIHGLLFTPLDIANTEDKKFGWLLYGNEADVRMIHGTSGYCPKILHTIGQVTHLAAKFKEDPDPMVIPVVAKVILARLERIVQWSEISTGYPTTEEQLAACKLTEEGLIDTPGEMTQLNAECWKLSAQLYLMCRLQRLPRNNKDVLRKLDLFAECMNRMPCNGRLFTSQSPFVPAFLLGFVSVQEHHRKAARRWFVMVMAASNGRSSVPPVWEALSRIWEWMDANIIDTNEELSDSIERRDPWWEKAVERLMNTEGTVAVT